MSKGKMERSKTRARGASLGVGLPLVAPLLYASLVVFFPWSAIRVSNFRDLQNYSFRLEAISNYGSDYFDLGTSVLEYFTNEFVWYQLLVRSIDLGVSSDNFFLTVSFFSAFVAARFMCKEVGSFSLLLILINPISLDLYLSQIRSALAFSLVLIGILSWRQWSLPKRGWLTTLSILPFLIAPFVHSSMALAGLVFLFSKYLQRKGEQSRWHVGVLAIFAGLSMAIVAIIFGDLLLSELGDRRSLNAAATRSTLYILPWIIVVGIIQLWVGGRSGNDWTHTYSLCILTFTVVCEMMGVAMFRMIALSLPIILASASRLSPTGRHLAYLFFSVYTGMLFLYWFGI